MSVIHFDARAATLTRRVANRQMLRNAAYNADMRAGRGKSDAAKAVAIGIVFLVAGIVGAVAGLV